MIPRSSPKPVHRYALPLGAFAFAFFMNSAVKLESPFVLFLAVVLGSAWYGGLGPGLLITLISAASSHLIFLTSDSPVHASASIQHFRLVLFVTEGVLISLLAEAYRRKEAERAQAEAVRQQLLAVVQRKQDLVQALSEGFLKENPDIPGFEAAYFYQPSARDDMVGGDCFDFIPLEGDRHGIFIGDVCGKGLSAALYTSKTKNMLRAYAYEDPMPETVVRRLNRALERDLRDEGMFVSLIYGVLDKATATFTYANAGHPQPLLYDPETGRVDRLDVTGGVAGADPEMPYHQQTVALSPGAVLLFFTDGLMEAVGSDDPYADGGVSPLIRLKAEEGAEAVARTVFERARGLADKYRRDDMAIIAVRRVGTHAPAEREGQIPQALAS